MAWTETNNLTLPKIKRAISEVNSVLEINEKDEAFAQDVLFVYSFILGIACPYAGGALALLAQGYNKEVNKVLSKLRNFKDELYKYRDALQEDPNFDKIKVQVEFDSWRGSNGKYYDIPLKSTVIGMHHIKGGWV